MNKRLLKLLLLSPDLLKMHAHGYADLATEEWALHVRAWQTRLLFYALGTASLLLGVFLAGVSLLLWTALPEVNAHSAWLMWFVPLALGLFALACWARAKRIKVARPFGKLKAQIALDILALRQNQEP